MKKIISILLTFMFLVTWSPAYGDSFKVVSLGGNLNEKQKQDMLNIFNVKEGEAEIITVTIEEEKQYLSGIAPASAIGNRSISSAYVEPLKEGSGVIVSTINLTWVTESMIANALTTAGIKDAKVIAAAPFKVSGTGALTGIIKGFEKATGEKIDPKARDAANREIVTTGELGETLGKEKAVEFMSEIKKEVITNKIKNPDDIRTIIEKVAKHYDVNLSNDQINQIIDVMQRISKLDLNIAEISNQLKEISGKLSKVIDQGAEAKSILDKIVAMLQGLIDQLKNLFR